MNQDGNYTKHYYADDARIASKIGNGYSTSISSTNITDTMPRFNMKKELGDVTNDIIDNIVYPHGQINNLTGAGVNIQENGLYFYHGNHLSSTQMVTDVNGNVSQAILYNPWGSIISEYKADWKLDTIPRYFFNSKEKDDESGLYYYEARYYSDEDIVFTARDPHFENYQALSPYNYCMNNPVIYIDPDGRDNVIYLVNLQGANKVDAKKVAKQTNSYFRDLGLKTRVAVVGRNFDPSKMDKTDSYAVLSDKGTASAEWIKGKDPSSYKGNFENFGNSGNVPEYATNTGGEWKDKSKAIALDAENIVNQAREMGVSTTEYAALTIMHGAGHNVGFNHSIYETRADPVKRYDQDKDNCRIMIPGSRIKGFLNTDGKNFQNILGKDYNSLYIKIMSDDKYFGKNPAKTYWGEIIE